MTRVTPPGTSAALLKTLCEPDADAALDAVGREDLKKILAQHREAGNPELGAYLVLREWFDRGDLDWAEEALMLQVCIESYRNDGPQELVHCDSLEEIIEEVKGRLGSDPFIPFDGPCWVCPKGDPRMGTHVAIIDAQATFEGKGPATLDHVMLRLDEPQLERGGAKRWFDRIVAEFQGSHAFSNEAPPREFGRASNLEGESFRFKFRLRLGDGDSDCDYAPQHGHEVYALIITKGEGKAFAFLCTATLRTHTDGDPFMTNAQSDRQLVYDITRFYPMGS